MNSSRAFEPVERPRIMSRLDRAGRYKITVVAAPAGYGKSIAVRQYLGSQDGVSLRVDVAREAIRIDGIVRAFGRAFDTIVPGARESLNAAIERCLVQANPRHELAEALVAIFPQTSLLVAVDGLTAPMIDDEEIRELLLSLIERSGENARWLLATRTTGALPLATWMAYDAMEAPITETDLAFTADESALVAAASASRRTPKQIEELFTLTQGWPTAFVLALRSPEQPDRLRNVSGTNQMIFDYLAEQVFSLLDRRERDFLFATCVLPSIDLPVVASLCAHDAREIIERLRKLLPLIHGDTDSSFTYQPLFRDFLEYQLRMRGEAAFHEVLVAAASALERVDRFGAALEAFVRAEAVDDAERLLAKHGFELLERGDVVRVTEAIAFLRRLDRGQSPSVLALRGTLEGSVGNAAWAMQLYESALSAASDAKERSWLAYRYALELIKRNDPIGVDALARIVPLLENARTAGLLTREYEPALAGTLAIAYTMLDRAAEAAQRISEALATVSADENPRLQAVIYHQASYIAYVAGDAQRSSRMATAALRLAIEQRNLRLATRSCSIRFSVARGLEDDADRAFEHLAAMHEFAEKSGDRTLQCEALAGMLDIEAERGNEAGIRVLEERIDACQEGLDIQTTSVLPATALVAAWQGDFRLAYDQLVRSDADQPTPLRRGLRLAEIALYAAASDQREAAVAAAGDALHLARTVKLRNVEDRRRYARTLALTALTYVTVGNTSTANGVLSELERARREMSARTRAIVEAVRALYLRAEIGSEEPVTDALTRLRAAGHGGLARLIEALPLARIAARSSISLLTPAEIDVLRVLARGGSSTKVAAELQRSVNTVNVHVKSIMRKLSCTSRYEAIAIAREHGLVS